MQFGAVTSLFLLCYILRIVKIKDLANVIATTLFLPFGAFIPKAIEKPNGYKFAHGQHESKADTCISVFNDSHSSSSSQTLPICFSQNQCHDLR